MLGILSMAVCGVLGPIAIVIGSRARGRDKPGRYASTSTVTAGWVCGIVGTVFRVLAALWLGLMLLLIGRTTT